MINRISQLSKSPFDNFKIELKNKSITFWRSFLPHFTDLSKSSIFLDVSLEIEVKGVLEVIYLCNKERMKGVKLTTHDDWESDDETNEDGSDLGLSSLFGKIKRDDFEGRFVSLDEITGERFTIVHVSLLDYYIFFRELQLFGEAEFVKEKLHHVKRIEILLFLFLKCVRLYENEKVKELFLKKKSKKQTKKKMKKKKSPSKNSSFQQTVLPTKKVSYSSILKELNLEVLGLHHEQLRSNKVINFDTSFASTLFHILQVNQVKLRNPKYLEHIFHFLDLLGYSKPKSKEENVMKGNLSIMEKLYTQLENRTIKQGPDSLQSQKSPEYYHNLILISKEKTKFYVHKEVVALRSQYFNELIRTNFGSTTTKNEENEEEEEEEDNTVSEDILEVDLYDVDIQQLLCFFYTSIVELKDVGENNDFESFLRLFVFLENKAKEEELLNLFSKYIRSIICKIPNQSLRENFLRFGYILHNDSLRNSFCLKCCCVNHGGGSSSYEEEEHSGYFDNRILGRRRSMRYITMSYEMNEIENRIKSLMKANLSLEEKSKKLREENEDLKKKIELIRKEKNL